MLTFLIFPDFKHIWGLKWWYAPDTSNSLVLVETVARQAAVEWVQRWAVLLDLEGRLEMPAVAYSKDMGSCPT